jgi:uncharacterized membrane protein
MTIPKNARMMRNAVPTIPLAVQTTIWAIERFPIGARLKYETIKRVITPHTVLMSNLSPFLRKKITVVIAMTIVIISMVSIMLDIFVESES